MDIMDQLRPYITEIAVILLTAFAGWAVQRVQAWTGIQIEAADRAALQSALANAAHVVGNEGIEAGIDYVEKSVPDALRRLKVLTRERIEELLAPHLGRLDILVQKAR